VRTALEMHRKRQGQALVSSPVERETCAYQMEARFPLHAEEVQTLEVKNSLVGSHQEVVEVRSGGGVSSTEE
jgi:hypothetical protein